MFLTLEVGSAGLFAGDSEAFPVMIHGKMWTWLTFAENEFHYVDMRLDKIELVFWYEVRNVFIFNRSLRLNWVDLIWGELSCLQQLFILEPSLVMRF